MMNEVAYYPQLAECIELAVKSNLSNNNITVKALYLPDNGSNIRSFLDYYISQGVTISEALKEYAVDVPKLRTDIAVVLDNAVTNKFEIIIIEAKLLGSAGLTELSQLIGYCLVTKAKYGILVNINGGASNELAQIITTDLDLMNIERKLSSEPHSIIHKIGVMTYSPETKNLSYIPTTAIESLPQLTQEIEAQIN